MAQVQAAHAGDIAHETYLQHLISIYKSSGQVIEQHKKEEELATLQIKDGTEEVKRFNKAWEEVNAIFQKPDETKIKKLEEDHKGLEQATRRLTAADEELLKAQTKLDEANTKANFDKQIQVINQLAQFHLITEQQKERRLKALL
jgi:hypothetical protein